MQKITIFGGSGMTGVWAVQRAVDKGVCPKLLLRDPDSIPVGLKDKVDIIVGNVINYDDVKKAIQGSEGVAVVLGTRNNLGFTTEMSDGVKNIIKAMKELNVTTISACLSSYIIHGDAKVPPVLMNIHNEHKLMLIELLGSGLNWIGVCAPHISSDECTDFLTAEGKLPGVPTISKHNLGKFMVDVLDQPEFYKSLVGISNKVA